MGYDYDVDFYSNDHQMDVMVQAKLTGEGKFKDYPSEGYYEILEEPSFNIEAVFNDESTEVDLSKEETRRVEEVLRNMYWNGIK